MKNPRRTMEPNWTAANSTLIEKMSRANSTTVRFLVEPSARSNIETPWTNL